MDTYQEYAVGQQGIAQGTFVESCIHHWLLTTMSTEGYYPAWCRACGDVRKFPVRQVGWVHPPGRRSSLQKRLDWENEMREANTLKESHRGYGRG